MCAYNLCKYVSLATVHHCYCPPLLGSVRIHCNHLELTHAHLENHTVFRDEREKIIQNLPAQRDANQQSKRKYHYKIGFADLAKTIAARWKQVDEIVKHKYEEEALVERNAYNEKMQAWKKQRMDLGLPTKQPRKRKAVGKHAKKNNQPPQANLQTHVSSASVFEPLPFRETDGQACLDNVDQGMEVLFNHQLAHGEAPMPTSQGWSLQTADNIIPRHMPPPHRVSYSHETNTGEYGQTNMHPNQAFSLAATRRAVPTFWHGNEYSLPNQGPTSTPQSTPSIIDLVTSHEPYNQQPSSWYSTSHTCDDQLGQSMGSLDGVHLLVNTFRDT